MSKCPAQSVQHGVCLTGPKTVGLSVSLACVLPGQVGACGAHRPSAVFGVATRTARPWGSRRAESVARAAQRTAGALVCRASLSSVGTGG